MAIPAGWSTTKVYGTYLDINGAPKHGRLHFKPRASRLLIQEEVVISDIITVQLDATGYFEVLIPVTNDPDVMPENFSYEVREDFKGGSKYNIAVPISDVPLNIYNLAPVAPNSGISLPLTRLEYESVLGMIGKASGIAPLGSNGLIPDTFLPPYNFTSVRGIYYPEDFDAVGDGVADDSAALNAAFAAAGAAGGGVVSLTNLYGWSGEIYIPNAVQGKGVGKGVESTKGLKALDSTSVLKCGKWSTNNPRIAGLSEVTIDGNFQGDANGLVVLQSVMAGYSNITIKNAAGHGLVLDAAQNSAFVGVDTTNCGTVSGGANVLLKNGAGGVKFVRCENTPGTGGRGLLITDYDSTSNNAYPFGSAHVTFDTCIFEAYVDGNLGLVEVDAGANVRFISCGFSNNNVLMGVDALVRISNGAFPTISTHVIFDQCNYNGGSAQLSPCVRVLGNQRVVFTGDSFWQQTTDCIIQDGGNAVVIRDGSDYFGNSVPVAAQRGIKLINGGSAVAHLNDRQQGFRFNTLATEPQPIAIRERGDSGVRFVVNSHGGLAWGDGSDFTYEHSLARDETNDNLSSSSMMVTGRRGNYFSSQTISVTGTALTLDSKAQNTYWFNITGTGSVASMTVTNALQGAELTVILTRSGTQTFAWDSNMRFVGGAAPTLPSSSEVLTVRFVRINLRWVEIQRTTTPT